MFVGRGRSSGRWLGVRMAAFGAGALLALTGMALGRDWIVGAAGLVLLAGILLGLVARRLDERAVRRGSDGDRPGNG
jgi:hypothetical protein